MTTPWTISTAARWDQVELERLFAESSVESVIGRFFAPVRRWPARYLAGVLMQRPYDHDAAVVRYGDGLRIAALASVVRSPEARRPSAELGVLVADQWQGRGLGRALVRHVTDRAVERGVEVLTASVLPGRTALLDALGEVGPLVGLVVDADAVTGHFDLTAAG